MFLESYDMNEPMLLNPGGMRRFLVEGLHRRDLLLALHRDVLDDSGLREDIVHIHELRCHGSLLLID